MPALSIDIDLDILALFGEALADETRRRILVTLVRGPAYPGELARSLGASRASVSNHLACLRGCGLVSATPEGRRMRYELVDDRLAHALQDLTSIPLAVDPAHPHRPERGR